MAFLGAISDNGGLEAYTIHPYSITTKEFIEFVEILSDKFHGQDFAIFMDKFASAQDQGCTRDMQELESATYFQCPIQSRLQRHRDILLSSEG